MSSKAVAPTFASATIRARCRPYPHSIYRANCVEGHCSLREATTLAHLDPKSTHMGEESASRGRTHSRGWPNDGAHLVFETYSLPKQPYDVVNSSILPHIRWSSIVGWDDGRRPDSQNGWVGPGRHRSKSPPRQQDDMESLGWLSNLWSNLGGNAHPKTVPNKTVNPDILLQRPTAPGPTSCHDMLDGFS